MVTVFPPHLFPDNLAEMTCLISPTTPSFIALKAWMTSRTVVPASSLTMAYPTSCPCRSSSVTRKEYKGLPWRLVHYVPSTNRVCRYQARTRSNLTYLSSFTYGSFLFLFYDVTCLRQYLKKFVQVIARYLFQAD